MLTLRPLPHWAHCPTLSCPPPALGPPPVASACDLTDLDLTDCTGSRLVGRGWTDLPGNAVGAPVTAAALHLLFTAHRPDDAGAVRFPDVDSEPEPAGEPYAIGGCDLRFTPGGPPLPSLHVSAQTWAAALCAAQDAAVTNVLGWLEDRIAFTRRGPNGVAQADTRGILAALLTHTGPEGDRGVPHTHVLLSRKVQDDTGRWCQLDPEPLARLREAAAERYRTRFELHLDQHLNDTRPNHHGPAASPAEPAEPAGTAGRDPGRGEPATTAVISWLIEEVIDTVSARRPVWQAHDIHAETERVLRHAQVPHADVDDLAEQVAAAVLDEPHSTAIGPPEEPALRRRDGTSVYTHSGTTHYSSTAVLDYERLLAEHLDHSDSEPASRGVAAILTRYSTDLNMLTSAITRSWQHGSSNVIHLATEPRHFRRLGGDGETGSGAMTVFPLAGAHRTLNRSGALPGWAACLTRRTLVVVLDAHNAGAPDLGAILRHTLERGGSLRLLVEELPETYGSAAGALTEHLQRNSAGPRGNS